MYLRVIITFLIFTVLPAIAIHAESVRISGLVTDEKNEPMEFASVRIEGTAIGSTTGLDGRYSLSTPASDTIRVVFSCIGYEDSHRKLITPDSSVTLNVKLQPKSYALQGVEITEIAKQTGTVQKISAEAGKLAPDATGGSVEGLLTTMGGVTSGNEMSSQYNVRGGTFDENLVYINGIEVYRPQLVSSGQQEGLSIINPDMVGAIGFSTGGFSPRYGDKMSSVLDITYRQPESFEGAVSASLMGASVTLGTSSRRFTQLHGVRYKSNASLLSSMDDKGEYDPRYFDYQTNMTYSLNKKFKVSFLGNIAINNYSFIPHDRTTSFGTSTDAKQFKVYFDGAEKDRFETWFGAMSLSWIPSTKTYLDLMASGFLTNELVSYDISGEYWLDQAGTSGSGNNDAIGGELGVGRYHEHARNRLKASVMTLSVKGATGINAHTLEYGVNINAEKIRDRSREWELRDSAGYSLPFDPDALRVIYNLESHHDVSSTRAGAFIQDNYRMPTSAGYLNITGGLRFSYWSFNREFLVSPRISVGFIPDKAPRWAFRFATGLYYQSPFYKEYRMTVADTEGNNHIELNNDIKSPMSLQFVAGTDYTFRSFGRPFKLSAEAYYKALSRLIPFEVDNLKVVYTGINESKGFAAGIDMRLYGQFVPGSDSWVSFSLMKTSEDIHGVKVPRPTDRGYSFGLYFTDYFPKWPRLKFSLKGILSQGLPTTAPHQGRDENYFRAPAYKRVDMGLAYGIVTERDNENPRSGLLGKFRSMWLGIDVFNLFDISNVSSYYWVTDVNDIQYAVPNYLTRRQINVRLSVEF